jgi:hypothetical protein
VTRVKFDTQQFALSSLDKRGSTPGLAFRGLGVGRVGQGVVQLSLLLEDHLEVVERAAGDRLVEGLEQDRGQERPDRRQELEVPVNSALNQPHTGPDMKSPCKVLGVRQGGRRGRRGSGGHVVQGVGAHDFVCKVRLASL